ncbi:MAG: Two-component system, sensor histidine kinase RegB [Myxococcaceae bacterium]|nr:Two-component system, sensor histidine kinase RegB [Myxococcaceae bacterium]
MRRGSDHGGALEPTASAAAAPMERVASARNLAWLVRLRWFAVASQALTVLVAERVLHMQLSTDRLYAIVAATAISNLACALWLRRDPHVREGALAALMAFDFVLLTALLQFAGGPSNPFTCLYLVHIALAAVVLRPSYAWALATLSAACFGALFALPSESANPHSMHMNHAAHGQAEMNLHLQGMWIAFAVAAFVIAYFVTRVTRDLEEQRRQAAFAQARALRSEKLASLATLAAGAAHELATPLATIAVVAKELQRELSTGHHADDARLIRDEVERCKHILEQMASDAGESAGEAFSRLTVGELVDKSLEGLSEASRVTLELAGARDAAVKVPCTVFARALRGLLRNALQASSEQVIVRAQRQGAELSIEVRDRGTGMSPEVLANVGEPFFTTKPVGQGMGLGVFLARALCDRLGGRFELSSALGEGSCARVVLPVGE